MERKNATGAKTRFLSYNLNSSKTAIAQDFVQ